MDNQRVTTTNSDSKKNSKPVMEKRRRARINASLAELKSLLLDAIKMEGTRHSKMEKADILELAVRHLKDVQNHPFTAATNPSSSVLSKYVMGFQACTAEVSKYLSHGGYEDFTLKSKLLNHLADCLEGGENLPNSPEITSSTLHAPSSLRDEVHNGLTSSLNSSLSTSKVLNQRKVYSDNHNFEETAVVNQSQVTSSTQNNSYQRLSTSSLSSLSPLETPLSSSLLPSSHYNQQMLDTSLMANKTDKDINNSIKNDKVLRKESIIVTSKDDENDDISFNDTDDENDDESSVCKYKNDDEKMTQKNDDHNEISFQTQMYSLETAEQTAVSNKDRIGLSVTAMPTQSQPISFQIMSENSQQVNGQTVHQSQQQSTTNCLQQSLSAVSTLPYLGQNIQLVSAQPNANEITMVLPANILSANGSIQKLYIPVLQPQTVQPRAATLITPQIFQPHQMPTIQLQNIQQTLVPSLTQQLLLQSNVMSPNVTDPSKNVFTKIISDSDRSIVHRNQFQSLMTTDGLENAHDCNQVKINVSDSSLLTGNKNSQNMEQHQSQQWALTPTSDGSCCNNLEFSNSSSSNQTGAVFSDQQSNRVIHHQKHSDTNQTSKDNTTVIKNKGIDLRSLLDINEHTQLPKIPSANNSLKSDTPAVTYFPHNLSTSNASTSFLQSTVSLESSLSVITTSPSDINDNNNNTIDTSFKHRTFQCNRMNADLSIPISSRTMTTIDSKRPHSPPPTETHKRFLLDYTSSKDNVYSTNVLDLSIPWAKQENDRVPGNTYNNFIHGSEIMGRPPTTIGSDGGDTFTVTEIRQKDIPTATKNNNLCKGSFFRPW